MCKPLHYKEFSIFFEAPLKAQPGFLEASHIVVGSFTYNINDVYIVCPDGSLVLEPSFLNKKNHEAYYEREVIKPDGTPKLTDTGKPIKEMVMKDDYHFASYDELYSWAIRRAAEKAKITHILAVKSFLTTTTKTAMGVAVARQDVTLTVYGESQE